MQSCSVLAHSVTKTLFDWVTLIAVYTLPPYEFPFPEWRQLTTLSSLVFSYYFSYLQFLSIFGQAGLHEVSKGHMLADVVAIIGKQ